jgi:hypothetical protein
MSTFLKTDLKQILTMRQFAQQTHRYRNIICSGNSETPRRRYAAAVEPQRLCFFFSYHDLQFLLLKITYFLS